MRLQKYLPLGAFVAATAIAGCGSNNASSGPIDGNVGGSTSTSGTGGTHAGGATGLGGATGNVGGNATGGANVGGNATGGAPTGGNANTGGANVGGNATGGAPTGGNANTGGANVGGNATGGAATGGANVGGSATGGVATGGANVGGNATGGKATGGANVGGSATGGVATGGANVGGNATGGKATGGANVGGSATGGTPTATGGTVTATGGSTGAALTPATPACAGGNNSEGVPNAANPPVGNVISDFNTNDTTNAYPCVADPQHPENACTDSHLIVYKNGARGGVRWYSYTDYNDDQNCDATTGACTARATSLPTLSWDGSEGDCTTGGALKAVGTGITADKGKGRWGSGIGVDFTARNSSNQKVPYDASAYTGIGFNMKCQSDVGYVYFKLVDAVNDGDCDPASCGVPKCVYSGGTPLCNQYGYKNAWITKNWANYELYFADALQDPNVNQFGSGIDKSKLVGMQIQFNTGKDTTGNNPVANAFTCWIDDVHFLTSNPPTPQTTCSSAYTTSGNKIMCGSTQKIFRGVARPSMEWDTSGWNVMPWDMARIKNGWKANVVRIGMNQDFYLGTSTASTASIYPKNLARAVRWAEAYGMDVILDLHWVDKSHDSTTQNYMASTSTNSPAFWKAVATAFKSDNHVMFELYNEPTITSWTTWHTNFTDLYNAVRSTTSGAGASQIVIIGGLDWAYDLSGVTANAITGTNIVYNTHPYSNKGSTDPVNDHSDWDAKFGNLAKTVPVMATEFGSYDCKSTWTTPAVAYFEDPTRTMSWTAWGWYAGGGCQFPSLISSYDGTTLNGTGSNADASRSVMMSKN